MNKKKPNNRNRTKRRYVPTSGTVNTTQKSITVSIKKFFMKVGQFFADVYRRYDAFVKRILKLDDDTQVEESNERIDTLSDFTRTRKPVTDTDSSEKPLAVDESDTKDFTIVPPYLQQKEYADEVLKTMIDDPQNEHHHLASIFKKRQKHRSFTISILLGVLKLSVVLMLVLGLSSLGVVQGIANAYVDTTPALDLDKIEIQDETSFIYDGNGNMVTSFVGLENRISAPIDEIPKMLQYAFIATEDERFYTHNGIDLKRIVGAFFNNIRKDTTHGGSTITQQLIKLRLLSREQTYKRKLQEAYLAMELEKQYNKDQILEAYLNTIDLGSGNYGVKAAANDYFNKELSELTLRECATLAGVANRPYQFNPRNNYYTRNDPQETDNRTNLVLRRMYENGYISNTEYEAALVDIMFVVEKSQKQQLYDMPYFLEYAVSDVISHFVRKRNQDDNATNRNIIENELRTSGYHIYTTVDPIVQNIVETSLYTWDKYPRTKYESDANVIVKNNDGTPQEIIQPQAAAVVFEYQTGQLKAIVGGRNEPTIKKGLNRAYHSSMPVGSSIKPLTVYGPALNKGVAPSAVILDIPTLIPGWTNEQGYPNNYGGTFSGPITMREAMFRSVNMAAVRILIDIVTTDDSYRTLEALGISPSHIKKDGSGLALGTSGITVLEMAVAYGAVGNKGTYIEPISFTQVKDSNGNVLLDATSMQINRTVFSPWASWLLVDMMKDVVNRGTGSKAKIDNITVAGKTGTNSDFRGVFFSGLTPYYSSALWVGHDNYEPLYSGAQGGRDAAPLWQDYMSSIHEQLDLSNKPIISDSPESLDLVKVETCPISGKLVTAACRVDAAGYKPIFDYVHASHAPTEICDWHIPVKICIDTNLIATQYCPITDPSSYIRIPPDSIIHKLSPEDFELYFPTGIKNYPEDPALFSIDNPEFMHLFCPIHTKQWHDDKVIIDEIIESSNTLIEESEFILINHSELIDDEVKTQANAQINDLKEKIKTRNYDLIKASYDLLLEIKTNYLDPIVPVVEDPDPEPSPTPAPEG